MEEKDEYTQDKKNTNTKEEILDEINEENDPLKSENINTEMSEKYKDKIEELKKNKRIINKEEISQKNSFETLEKKLDALDEKTITGNAITMNDFNSSELREFYSNKVPGNL